MKNVQLVGLSHITIILCLLNCVTDTIQVTEACILVHCIHCITNPAPVRTKRCCNVQNCSKL